MEVVLWYIVRAVLRAMLREVLRARRGFRVCVITLQPQHCRPTLCVCVCMCVLCVCVCVYGYVYVLRYVAS